HDREGRGVAPGDRVLVAAPRPRQRQAPRARGAAWPPGAPRPPARDPDADGVRRLRRARAPRGRERRLTPPLHAVVRYAARYRTRYLAGYACLVAGTGFSLAIPWTIKQAIEALERDAATAPLRLFVA